MEPTRHEIKCTFVCKDPEWDVTYTEFGAFGRRSSTFKIFVDTLCVGDLDRWDTPDEPIDAASQQRILERLAAWAFGEKAPNTLVAIVGTMNGRPLRLPG